MHAIKLTLTCKHKAAGIGQDPHPTRATTCSSNSYNRGLDRDTLLKELTLNISLAVATFLIQTPESLLPPHRSEKYQTGIPLV